MHCCPWFIQMKNLSLHLKNYQNFKGVMINDHSIDSNTLRQRIEAMPEDSILFRSDFPEYHAEFVGSTLSELTNEGVLTKIAQGIYAKPRKSRFGIVLPTVDKVVQAIATRDNAQFLPSGMTALIILGLSTQVPKNYTYLTLLRPGITFNASDAYPLIYETFIDKMEGKRD